MEEKDDWRERYRRELAEFNRMFGVEDTSPLWDDATSYGLPHPDERPLARVLPFRPRRKR